MGAKSSTKLAKKAAGVLTDKEFFEKLVEKSGYVDPVVIQRVYDGVVALMMDELKAKGGVRLPGIADVHLAYANGRTIHNRNMPEPVQIPPHHQVRMIPVRGVKAFFKMMDAFTNTKPMDPAIRAGLVK